MKLIINHVYNRYCVFYYEMMVCSVMVNNSTNINKLKNHILHSLAAHTHKERPWYMTLEIQVLAWNMHMIVRSYPTLRTFSVAGKTRLTHLFPQFYIYIFYILLNLFSSKIKNGRWELSNKQVINLYNIYTIRHWIN